MEDFPFEAFLKQACEGISLHKQLRNTSIHLKQLHLKR